MCAADLDVAAMYKKSLVIQWSGWFYSAAQACAAMHHMQIGVSALVASHCLTQHCCVVVFAHLLGLV